MTFVSFMADFAAPPDGLDVFRGRK